MRILCDRSKTNCTQYIMPNAHINYQTTLIELKLVAKYNVIVLKTKYTYHLHLSINR